MTTSSTSNENNAEGITVYPNPASDWLSVDLGSNENLPVRITLVDVCGKAVWYGKAESAMISIPVGEYVAGVYFLKMEMKQEALTRMFVISR